MPFCKKCGRLNIPDAKFCGVCGAPMNFEQLNPVHAEFNGPASSMPPPPPPPPPDYRAPPTYQQPAAAQPTMPTQNASEQVLGVILLRKPKSLGRYDSWTAVLTGYRMIFAQMTSQMITEAAAQAKSQAKAEGRGFWGQWEEQLRATFTYTQKYMTMDPNAILAEIPGNFALNNASISEVKLKLKDISRGDDVQVHEFELEVNSAQGKYEFRMEERNEFANLLKQVYGERVKMPFGYHSSSGVRIKLF
jgi:hypothetical protein